MLWGRGEAMVPQGQGGAAHPGPHPPGLTPLAESCAPGHLWLSNAYIGGLSVAAICGTTKGQGQGGSDEGVQESEIEVRVMPWPDSARNQDWV